MEKRKSVNGGAGTVSGEVFGERRRTVAKCGGSRWIAVNGAPARRNTPGQTGEDRPNQKRRQQKARLRGAGW